MKIACAQLDFKLGAFDSNVKKIKTAYARAVQDGARMLMVPELALSGYPPHDLLERPEMFERNQAALDSLLAETKGKKTALLVGHVAANPNSTGRAALNQVSVLENGKVAFTQAKTLLPTYDVFDEARYFEPAPEIKLWDCDGTPVAIAICEDLWAKDTTLGRKIYSRDPVDAYQKLGAKLVLSLSASPFEMEKRERREELHQEVAKRLGCPVVYVNQVGANDEILFDGGSFAVDSKGQMLQHQAYFEEAYGLLDLQNAKPVNVSFNEDEILIQGLVLGIRDYFQKNGFKKAILGLSGGIDSAVVAVLAAQALGSENVLGVAMPSQYSSPHSLEDAEILARNLSIKLEVKPIKFLFSTLAREIGERRGTLKDIALENLQSRMRGMILMTLANHDDALVLTTGNKSEIATGYCTLYGDMVGALGPIGDLTKTRVYALARALNQKLGTVIPERTITRAPSAELKPNQTDQDTLPDYAALDAFLEDYLEGKEPLAVVQKRHPQARVAETLKRIEFNEYKRRQAAPVLKVTRKAFGMGRRIPITKSWDA